MKFSIVMAAYNAEKYISYAIESVIKQTYHNWQLVIVDDGSTDNTGSIANTYASKDERILVIHQKNSGTAAAARNTALKYVNGDYIQMLDSDDYLSYDCLEKYEYTIRKSRESIDVISPILISVNNRGDVLGEITNASSMINQFIDGKKAFEFSIDWKIHGCVCVKTDLQR